MEVTMPLFARRPASLLLGLGMLAAGIAPTSAQDSATLKPVSLFMYSVAPDLGDAPLWIVPHALGYFADEGLQVGVEYAGGSSGALQLLAAGKGQFATSTPTQVMLATHQGLKIKSVFEHNRTYGSALMVPTTAGITTLEQLRGHLKGSNIGVASMSSGRIPYARAWIRELGLQEDTDVKLVAVGVGPQAAAALKSDRVRALVIYDAVYAAIEAATDVRFTRFETAWQKPLFSGVVVTSDKIVQEDPDLVGRMGRAMAKALVFATSNPEAVVRIYWKLFPENQPAADKQAEELKSRTVVVNSMVNNWLAGMEKPGTLWGSQSEAMWNDVQNNDLQAGLISATRPVADYYTSRFEAQCNDFDAAAVRRSARGFADAMIRFTKTK
jgi:NitT/TauT family transport system substrate-binding protein